jgi:hypothetical protein
MTAPAIAPMTAIPTLRPAPRGVLAAIPPLPLLLLLGALPDADPLPEGLSAELIADPAPAEREDNADDTEDDRLEAAEAAELEIDAAAEVADAADDAAAELADAADDAADAVAELSAEEAEAEADATALDGTTVVVTLVDTPVNTVRHYSFTRTHSVDTHFERTPR